MFDIKIYKARRTELKKRISSGLILFLANHESPMNYKDNQYRFRQDSSFLYYTGIDEPNIAAILDIDENKDILFADDPQVDDIIWMGQLESFNEKAMKSGMTEVLPFAKLSEVLSRAKRTQRNIHYIKPYRAEHIFMLMDFFGKKREEVETQFSLELTKAIVVQRNKKSDQEIEEIEKAHDITRQMHITAMQMAKPGMRESEIAGTIEGIALSNGPGVSFPAIVSVRGEILHNHSHGNYLKEGDLLVNDSGAESCMHYAADITRTFPVSGTYTTKQREIYEIVLQAQITAIEQLKPGILYKDIHLNAAKAIAEGLKALGLMKGDMEEAVQAGAHALFLPHGLGHMMGLDVHDMENLGEEFVGYAEGQKRSEQFGLAYLRLARKLESGFVLTVEPGIYFIPELYNQWALAKRFDSFINYEKVKDYLNFGGIRIEDDVLITSNGHRVLGKPIPKTIRDIEEIRKK